MAKSKKEKRLKLTGNGHHKYFDDQFDDEEVWFVFRKHPIVMRKGLIYGSVALLAGPLYTLVLTMMTKPGEMPPSMLFFYASFLASILLMCVIMFPFWLSWYFSVFIITSQRFIEITQKGFFRRHVSDVPLNLIQSVNYEIVGIEQTLLGFGTLIVQTFIGESKLHHIHHPAKVQRKIAELMKIEGITPSPNATVLRRIEEEEGKEYD